MTTCVIAAAALTILALPVCEGRGLREAPEVMDAFWSEDDAPDTPDSSRDALVAPLTKAAEIELNAKASWQEDAEHWVNDVFSRPGNHSKSSNLLSSGTRFDWAQLFTTVIVLALFDIFFISRWCGVQKDKTDMLLEVFNSCDSSGTGRVTKDTLVSTLANHKDVQTMLRTHSGAAVQEKLLAIASKCDKEISWDSLQATISNLSEDEGKESRSWGSMRTHLGLLCFWVLIGLAFNALVYVQKGSELSLSWSAGYLLEWLLSMDNLFIFHLVFQTYKTPRALLPNVLLIGVLGAVVCRMLFFAVFASLLNLTPWVRVIFGLLLIYSGIQAARGDDDDEDVCDNLAVSCLRQVFGSRIKDTYDMQGRLFLWENGRLVMSMTVPVIVCLIFVDTIFALDSVSAKVAQIPNYYISCSSSVLAMFGLRSMFFVIQELVDCFELLKYGLCLILVFIGIELMLAPWVKLPASTVLIVIVAVFAICVAGSAAMMRSATGAAQERLKESEAPEATGNKIVHHEEGGKC
jgi:tellurite resistance protein TerC